MGDAKDVGKAGVWSAWPSAIRAEQFSATVHTDPIVSEPCPPIRKIRWSHVWAWTCQFLSSPFNMALTFWCLIMGIPFLFAVLLQLGAFDAAIPDPTTRSNVSEYVSVTISALYVVLMAVFHVLFVQQSFILFRWSEADVRELRGLYCKRGTRKPFEWAHMQVVIFFLHLMCLVSYAYGILFFIDVPTQNHKVAAVTACMALSFVFPTVSGVYHALSPLNKSYLELEEPTAEHEERRLQEVQSAAQAKDENGFTVGVEVVENPEWDGRAVMGFCADPRTAALSCFCSCCMLGYNVQRLQLGNSFMQGATLFVCTFGSFFIFVISAHVVPEARSFKRALTLAGIACALIGFVFGGFWRARMRHAFGLPPGLKWGFGSAYCTDLLTWIFCWPCALSQEVRTADAYDVDNEKFVVKKGDGDGDEMQAPYPPTMSTTEDV